MIRVLVENAPMVIPLNSYTRPPLIARIGGLSEEQNSARLCLIESQLSPFSLTSMLKPDLSFNVSVFLSVSVLSLHQIVEASEVEVTTPITSTFIFGLAFFYFSNSFEVKSLVRKCWIIYGTWIDSGSSKQVNFPFVLEVVVVWVCFFDCAI